MTTRSQRAGPGIAVIGPGDDAAVLPDGTAITVDTLVEGLHWDRRLSPEDVGFKALAVSASDLAAMGATPSWAVLSLSLPRPLDRAWIDAFSTGLAEACGRFGVDLVGGDTTGSPGPRVVSITAGGPCPRPVRRNGARPGDGVWVTGWLGLAGAGWRREAPGPDALAALRRPNPPVPFGVALASTGIATAMMDLSDGLARDLRTLCAASGVGARIDASLLPIHPSLGPAGCDDALRGGEDYGLLFTAAPDADVAGLARSHRLRVTRIGHVVAGDGPRLTDGTWPRPAFDPFRGGAP